METPRDIIKIDQLQLDYQSLNPSDCLSQASSSLPSDSTSPITTPTSIHSKGPFSSPRWPTVVGPSFVPTYGKPSPSDGLYCHDDDVRGLLLPSDTMHNRLECLPSMIPQPPVFHDVYSHCRDIPQQTQLSNASLSLPFSQQNSNSAALPNPLQWMPPTKPFLPQTVASSHGNLFPNSLPTPQFPSPSHMFKMQSPALTQCRSMEFTGDKSTMRQAYNQSAGAYDQSPITPQPLRQASIFNNPQLPTTGAPAVKPPALKHSFSLEDLSIIEPVQYRCTEPGCKGRFKRQEHLKRHMKSHSRDRPYVCWVPGCHRAFSRSDNLNAHYGKTHSKRGGRNRYVATLDETSNDYDPDYRGQLTLDGRPIYGSSLEEYT